jgi:DNA-binding transcriptional ArsR family regulator
VREVVFSLREKGRPTTSNHKRPLRDPSQVARARRRIAPLSAEGAIARIQKVLCDPARLRIVEALTVGPLCVDDLAATIDRAPAATSQHLRVLRDVGLVEGIRQGTMVQYRLPASPAVEQVAAILRALVSTVPGPS